MPPARRSRPCSPTEFRQCPESSLMGAVFTVNAGGPGFGQRAGLGACLVAHGGSSATANPVWKSDLSPTPPKRRGFDATSRRGESPLALSRPRWAGIAWALSPFRRQRRAADGQYLRGVVSPTSTRDREEVRRGPPIERVPRRWCWRAARTRPSSASADPPRVRDRVRCQTNARSTENNTRRGGLKSRLYESAREQAASRRF